MTWVVMGLLVVVGGVFQTLTPMPAWLGPGKVPFLLCVVLYYCLGRGPVQVMGACLMAGLMQDALSPMVPLGQSVLCFLLISWLAGHFRKHVHTESIFAAIYIGAAAGMLATLVSYRMVSWTYMVHWPVGLLLLRSIGTAFITAICAPLVYVVSRLLDEMVGNVMRLETIDGFE